MNSKLRLNCVKSPSWSPVICYVSREATHPPQALSHPKSHILQSAPDSCDPSSLPASYPLPSPPVHRGDSRDKHKDGNVHSTHSTPGCTDIHYLNDQPALDRLVAVGQSQLHERTDEDHSTKAQSGGDNLDISPSSLIGTRLSIPSSSPGSASQRLENLRRHQHDDKLERLKERIRRQRQHLQDTAESEKLLDPMERPIATTGATNSADFSNMAKIRKVAPAPPPPVYRGILNVLYVISCSP